MTQNPERIRAKISESVVLLAPHLRSWAEAHLIAPRQVRLSLDPDGTSSKDLWLVTDHVGTNDASYRVVYDDETDGFGLECTLETGVEWYMGDYGSFAETVENM
jgi:hypothetical protein